MTIGTGLAAIALVYVQSEARDPSTAAGRYLAATAPVREASALRCQVDG